MTKSYFARWIKAALIRALKTFGQAAVALIPVAIRITSINWVEVLETAAAAAILSILTSIAGLPEVKDKENNKSDSDKTSEE